MKKTEFTHEAGCLTFFSFEAPGYTTAGKYGRCSGVEIDLSDLIDRYDYHDAPSTVEFYPSPEELRQLRDAITKALQDLGEE